MGDETNQMRVLHVASGDLWAGAEVQIFLLVTELAKLPNMEVQVALMNDGELARRLRDSGVSVHVIDEGHNGPLAIIYALHRLMRQFGPTVVHSHRSKENVLAALANAFSTKASLVRTVHGSNEHPAQWTRQPLQRSIHCLNEWTGKRVTTHVIAVSTTLARSLATEHGYANVTAIPNGVDFQEVARCQARAPFAHGSSVRHIGLVGRLEPVKRGDLFLHAAAELTRRDLPFELKFHIFGDGSQRAALELLRAKLRLNAQVVFHGHTPQIVSWLGSLDAAVLCSDHEGLPMILLESLAAGTPVVAHAVGGIPEVMQHVQVGRLVTQHDATAYADAIESVLLTPVERSSVYHELEATYSAKRNAQLIAELYKRPRSRN